MPEANVSIRILHVFFQLLPTAGLVWGGSRVTIRGWGFRSGPDEYTCHFGNVTNSSLAVFESYNQLICISAPWSPTTSAAVVMLSIASKRILGVRYTLGNFEYQSAARLGLEDVMDRLGGTVLTIAGSMKVIFKKCDSSNRHARRNLPDTILTFKKYMTFWTFLRGVENCSSCGGGRPAQPAT